MQQNWKFQRGDIFFTHFGASTGSEQCGDRPAVILQNDVGNYHSPTLPVKGNKKRAESLLRKTQKEFNPETMQQVSDLPVSEYLNRWLRESVMNLPPETYGRYGTASQIHPRLLPA